MKYLFFIGIFFVNLGFSQTWEDYVDNAVKARDSKDLIGAHYYSKSNTFAHMCLQIFSHSLMKKVYHQKKQYYLYKNKNKYGQMYVLVYEKP